MANMLQKLFGSKSDREVKTYFPIVEDINSIYVTLSEKSDEELAARTREFQEKLKSVRDSEEATATVEGKSEKELKEQVIASEQEVLEEILPEAFAMVKETCRRLMGETWKIAGQPTEWNMIPYDVQLVGAVVLHRGKVTEMKTGEGKTLVATMPIYLNALTGRGVHVVTVNDYLATRDAHWMGKIYERLGLTVGSILNSMSKDERREIYNCDITYGTNNEFGFDYLRDNMSLAQKEQVQRGHAYAVIDEVDSILIDEARTPLIISGTVDNPTESKVKEFKPMVERLIRQQTSLVNKFVSDAEKMLEEEKNDEAGLLLLQSMRGAPKNRRLFKMFQEGSNKKLAFSVESAYIRDKRLHEVDDDLYFSIDEKSHVIDLTDKGREALSPDDHEMFIIPDMGEMLHDIENNDSLSTMEKRQETEKARLLHSERSEVIHNISQLLRAYSLYEKDVDYVVQDGKVLIVDQFTGRILPGRRYSEGLHQALEARENVKIERETQTLATITIQNYFRMYDKLSGMTGTAETEAEELHSIYGLDVTVIPTHEKVIREDHNDLVYKTKREKFNAVLDEIAECHKRGQPVLVGTITVEVSETLSRMIKRRGIPHNVLNAKQHKSEAEIVVRAGQLGAVTIATNMAGRGTDIKLGKGIVDLGGLHIIGTERHESRRIDLQLRGRAGRQGDPGSSCFYLCLEDDLMRLFGSDRIAGIMDKLGVEEGEVITHGMVTRSIERAQKKVEARNFSIRKRLLEYDDVMNQQREVIYSLRDKALHSSDVSEDIKTITDDYIDDLLEAHNVNDDWDVDGLQSELSSVMTVDLEESSIHQQPLENLHKVIQDAAVSIYSDREKLVDPDFMRAFERYILLRTIDDKWKDHLYAMDQLREGVNLRAYGQKDPLLEYKSEGFDIFVQALADVNREVIQRLYRTQLHGMQEAPTLRSAQAPSGIQIRHADSTGMGLAVPPQGASAGEQVQQRAAQAGKQKPITVAEKVGRNNPCPCGSGKKYKKCHGNVI